MAASRELQSLLASSDTISALDRYFKRTIERILRDLAAGVSRPGAARAAELLRTIQDIAATINPNVASPLRTWIRKHVPEAYILGDKSAVRQLGEQLQGATSQQRADFGPLNRAFTPVNSTSLRAIAGTFKDRMSDIYRQVLTTSGLAVRRTQLVFQQDAGIREQVVSGIIRGASGRQLSDDIARVILDGRGNAAALRRLRENGFQNDTIDLYDRLSRGEFITVGKRNFSVRTYANLTSRTMLREAHKVGTVVRLQQNGVDHVQISKHAQDKPDVCTAFAGRVFYVGALPQDPLGFPPLKSITNGGPPFHPNCAHVAQPYVVPLKGQKAVDSAREASAQLTARFFGKTAAEVTEVVEGMGADELAEINLQGRDAA